MTVKLLTTKEVGDVLRIAARTVRDMIDRGELAATRAGAKKWVVLEADLFAYIEARTTKGNVVMLAPKRSAR